MKQAEDVGEITVNYTMPHSSERLALARSDDDDDDLFKTEFHNKKSRL